MYKWPDSLIRSYFLNRVISKVPPLDRREVSNTHGHSTTLQPLAAQKKGRFPDSRPASAKKAPIYKDSSSETINFPSPQLGPRISITESPATHRTSMPSPTSSTCSSVRSPVIVRQSGWMNRDSNPEHPVNFLNGSAGKRDPVRFEESSLIIKTNHRSDDEQSTKICLLFKPGLKGHQRALCL